MHLLRAGRGCVLGALLISSSFVACAGRTRADSGPQAARLLQVSCGAGGSIQSQVGAQAVADLAASSKASTEELNAACRSIAQALDAPRAAGETIETDPMRFTKQGTLRWCDLATAAIKAELGRSKMKLTVRQPTCAVSVATKAACQARCLGSERCDGKANPPTCRADDQGETSARLEIACRGECTAKPGVPLACFGVCRGKCNGTCHSPAGVACEGVCEGTCYAAGGKVSAFDAHGACHGTCKGRCAGTEVGVSCNGTCSGECEGTCVGAADASAKCDGICKADYEPLKCWGGELAGGCNVDAKCESFCNAIVKAKAECRHPQVRVAMRPMSPRAAQLMIALEQNLPIIYANQQRIDGMFKVVGKLQVEVRQLRDLDPACLPAIVAAIDGADAEISAGVNGCGALLGTLESLTEP
jgi:hypothetical protein